MNRRRFVQVMAASAIAPAALAALTPAARPAFAQAMTPIREAGFNVLYMWPLFVAKERGFFAEEGIDFEYLEVNTGALGVASLVSGNAQFTDMGINDAANLATEGREMLMIYRLMRRVTLDMIIRKEVVERLGLSREMPLADRFAALKNLNIGITQPGAVTDVIARYYLRQANLEPDRDANLVPVGGAAALAAALRTGQIDSYLLSPPTPHQLEQEGIGSIIIRSSAGDVPALGDVPFASITVTKEYAEKNPDTVSAYVRAIKKAIAYGNANREDGLAITQTQFPDTPANVLALSWDALLPSISGEGTFTVDGVRGYLEIMEAGGLLRGGMPVIQDGVLWTNKFTG